MENRKRLLESRVAVVTGGTRGIGYAIVKKFLEEGAVTVLCGSREETAAKALAKIKEEYPDGFGYSTTGSARSRKGWYV